MLYDRFAKHEWLAFRKRWCRVWHAYGWLSTNVPQLVRTNDRNSFLDVSPYVSSGSYNLLFGVQAKKVPRHSRGDGNSGVEKWARAVLSKPLSKTKLCTHCDDGRVHGGCVHSRTKCLLVQKVRHSASTISLVLPTHLAYAFHWHWIHSKTTSNL